MRLNKFLSSAGIAARRKSDELIFSKKVRVNGHIVDKPGYRVEESDVVTVEDRIVKLKKDYIYIVLNKPKGYVSTLSDEKGRKNVRNLIDLNYRIYPVGRLDMNSTGVLLFTNDGDLTHKLLHPRYGVWKVYQVKLNRSFSQDDISKIENGIKLSSGNIGRGLVNIVSKDKKEIRIKIKEGKKHQIRLMMQSLGYFVKTLDRIQFGSIRKTGLALGEWRKLKRSEVEYLRGQINN